MFFSAGAVQALLSRNLVLMRGQAIDERTVAITELFGAAEEFAERAKVQEARRDRSRPGTGLHHQHAHSATLWRLAERTLRARIVDLELQAGA